MNIGIVSYLNPYEFRDYLANEDLPNINVGSSAATNQIVKGLLEEGHKIVVFTDTPEPASGIYKRELLEIHTISSYHKFPWFGTGSLIMAWRLYRALNNNQTSFDILHGHWTYQCGYAVSRFSKKMPVFCTVRDWYPNIVKYISGFFNHITWSLCRRFLFESIMHNKRVVLIANSEYIQHNISERYPERKSVLIHNPISIEDIDIDKLYHYNGPVYVSVAQNLMDLYKNIDTLVRAFQVVRKDIANAKLFLVGAYDKNHELYRDWANNDLLEGVTFMGFMNKAELRKLLQTTSIMVHPSLEESFGNVVVEGISSLNVIIGGKESGAIPFLLEGGSIGFLTDVTDVQKLATTMMESLNEETRCYYIKAAYNKIKEKYDYRKIAKLHADLYSSELETFV